jgi:diguanylate cyclase (GGDEF)-like protein
MPNFLHRFRKYLGPSGIAGFAVVCLLLQIAGAFAAPARSLRFENLNDRNFATPSSVVTALVQDKQGFIWMGTQYGVYRHDGQRSIIYQNDANDPHSLPGDYVRAIFRDKQDRLWFGTNKGLARFDAESDSFTSFSSDTTTRASEGNEFISSIVDDGNGGLWLGTSRGLQHFDPVSGKFEKFQHDPSRPDSLASDRVEALARDAQGGLWVSVWLAGIDYMGPGSKNFRHYRLDDSIHPNAKLNSVNALCIDSQQQLWIGTATGILLWRPGTEWGMRRALPGSAAYGEFWVLGIYEDRNGVVWVGTQPTGLLRWDPLTRELTGYRHQTADPHSLPSNRIYSMLVDRSDTLWVGARDQGVARADLASLGFGRFIPETDVYGSSPQGNVVDSLSRAGPGQIWLGGLDGLRLFDVASGRIVKSFRHDPVKSGTLSSNYVLAVLQQSGGPLWVGTADGLNRLDSLDGKFREIRFPLKEANAIRKIVAGSKGNLWIGTEGGIVHFDPGKGAGVVIPYGVANATATSQPSVNVLLEDRRGRLWVGNPYGLGLDVRDPISGRFTNYRHDDRVGDSLPNNFVRSIFEDKNGGIWVGTLKGLMQVIEDAEGRLHFHAVAGLSGIYIESIEGDDGGMLWATGATGTGEAALIRVDPAGSVKYYFASDGINSGDFFDGASLRDVDGTLYFGSMQGFTTVQPSAVRSNAVAPSVSVVDLTVANQSLRKLPRPQGVVLEGSLSEPKHLTLPWNEATFSVEFAAMHFADPQRNRYAYQLQGFDTDWIYTDAAHRTATYTNLVPGNYIWRVKAANKNGVWGDSTMALVVTVPPPVWATWWFRFLCVMIFVGVLSLAYRWQVAQLRRRQTQLESLVQQRTGELARKNDALSHAYAALENLSVTDPLTGLHNRRHLEQKLPDDLNLALRRYETDNISAPQNASLIFFLIDLDHFKQVNDRYGHAAGDHVLVEVRRRLQLVFRESDYLVRWGGEEFLAVARDTNAVKASELADRVCAAIADSDIVLEEGIRIRQKCSIGFACFPFSESQPRLVSWQQVVKLADLGLYAAKRSGRAAWVGLLCGADEIGQEQVRQMLQAPDAALAAGTMKASASVGNEALMRAWEFLAEQESD